MQRTVLLISANLSPEFNLFACTLKKLKRLTYLLTAPN